MINTYHIIGDCLKKIVGLEKNVLKKKLIKKQSKNTIIKQNKKNENKKLVVKQNKELSSNKKTVNKKTVNKKIVNKKTVIKQNKKTENKKLFIKQNKELSSNKKNNLDNKKIFDILTQIKQKATCKRMKTGAIIVKKNKIIAKGVNTAIKDASTCLEVGCLVENNHCHRTICAEQWCLYDSLKKSVSVRNSVLWSLHNPCRDCLKAIIASGIKEIHYFFDYEDEANKILAKEYTRKGLVKIVKEKIVQFNSHK